MSKKCLPGAATFSDWSKALPESLPCPAKCPASSGPLSWNWTNLACGVTQIGPRLEAYIDIYIYIYIDIDIDILY